MWLNNISVCDCIIQAQHYLKWRNNLMNSIEEQNISSSMRQRWNLKILNIIGNLESSIIQR